MACGFEIHQIAELDGGAIAQALGVFAVDGIVATVAGGLERVDEIAVKRVGLARGAEAIEAANGQRGDLRVESLGVAADDVFFEASETDAGAPTHFYLAGRICSAIDGPPCGAAIRAVRRR